MTNQFLTVMATLAATFFFAVAVKASRTAKEREHERDVFYGQLIEWEPMVNAYAQQLENRERSSILN